jgi:hypothetical protein
VSTRDDEAGDGAARARAEEQAWREIVDHYGERLDLPDEPSGPAPLPPPAVVSPERRVAWVVLIASPILLVLLNLLHYALPGILTGGLVIAFIAAFGYLVATMEPRDPDDDGARV